MTLTRVSIAAAGVAVLALLVIGLAQLHGSSSAPARPLRLSLAQMRAQLAGSPGPLSALHAQAGELLPGGLAGVQARLTGLHGQAVVVNKWASWCVPCHSELGAFQRDAREAADATAVRRAAPARTAAVGCRARCESRRDRGLAFLVVQRPAAGSV